MNTTSSNTASFDAARAGYTAPEVVDYGSVAELTATNNFGSGALDDGGGFAGYTS